MTQLRRAGDISVATSVVLLAIRKPSDEAQYGAAHEFSEPATRAFELGLKARMEDLSVAGWTSLHVLTTDVDRLGRRIERARDWTHYVVDTGKSPRLEWDTLLERCALGVDFLFVLFGDREAVEMERLWVARNLLSLRPGVVLFGEERVDGIATRVANLRVISRFLSTPRSCADVWEEFVRNEYLSIVRL